MPQIQQYDSQIQAEGAVGGTSPNLEQISELGKGVRYFGAAVEERGQMEKKQEIQVQSSDAFAGVSQATVDFNEDLNNQIATGDLDVDKFKEKIQDWRDKQSENYTHPETQNYFNRQTERMVSRLTTKAIRGKTVIEGNRAVADFNVGISNFSNSVQSDPESFHEAYDAVIEDLHTKSANGSIPAAQLPTFEKQVGVKLAESAVRGYAQQDADNLTNAIRASNGKVDPAAFSSAEKVLKSGAFDDYLDSTGKKKMESEIRTLMNAGETEGQRALQAQKSAKKLNADAWINNNISRIENGTMPTKEILNSPDLDYKEKHEILGWQRQAATAEFKTDPAVKNSIIARINLPANDPRAITDVDQIKKSVGNGISLTDYGQISSYIDKTPQGEVLKQNRAQLLTFAKAKLVKANPMIGQADPDGEYNLMNYTSALHEEEQKMRQAGEPVRDLYDPKSPKFFGNKVNQYVKSPQEIMKSMASSMRTGAPNPENVQTMPGKSVTPSAPQTEPNQPKEDVVERSYGGKVAVFDNKTKKFLRYK